MADQQKWVPDPPLGLHGPHADNALGSILDPATRKAIRQVLMPALVNTFRYLVGEILKGNISRPPDLGMPMPAPPQMPMQPPVPMPGAPGANRAGDTGTSTMSNAASTIGGRNPFPHGDMDLSFITANVVTPNEPRSGTARQFYFLKAPNVPGGG